MGENTLDWARDQWGGLGENTRQAVKVLTVGLVLTLLLLLIFWLFPLVFWICAAIALIIFVLMLYRAQEVHSNASNYDRLNMYGDMTYV